MLTSSNCSMHTSLREGVVQPMGLHVGTCLPGRGQPAARLGDFLSLWSSKAASERLLPCTLRAGPFLRNSSDASTSGLHRNYLHFNTMHDYPGSGSLSLSLSLSVSLSLSLSLSFSLPCICLAPLLRAVGQLWFRGACPEVHAGPVWLPTKAVRIAREAQTQETNAAASLEGPGGQFLQLPAHHKLSWYLHVLGIRLP